MKQECIGLKGPAQKKSHFKLIMRQGRWELFRVVTCDMRSCCSNLASLTRSTQITTYVLLKLGEAGPVWNNERFRTVLGVACRLQRSDQGVFYCRRWNARQFYTLQHTLTCWLTRETSEKCYAVVMAEHLLFLRYTMELAICPGIHTSRSKLVCDSISVIQSPQQSDSCLEPSNGRKHINILLVI